MAYHKSLSLLSWVLWQPLKFAVISFLMIMLVIMMFGIIAPDASPASVSLAVLVAFVASAFATYYKLPRENMDRRGFVALNNAQMAIVATIFSVAMSIIVVYKNAIAMKLMWFYTHFNATDAIIICAVLLLFLYLCGIFVTNLYAKYRRCREIGIAPWKIVCSMPFGFSLLWTPGYLLDDTDKGAPAVAVHAKWYKQLTNWVISRPIYTTLAFTLITIYSIFFYGRRAVMVTLACAVVFALWYRVTGLAGFRQQQGRKYALFAIAVNIVILACVIAYQVHISNMDITTINISDVATTQM